MKKYLPLVVVIIALAGVAGWFWYQQAPGTIEAREGDFGVKNIEKVTRIALSHTDGRKVELTKESTGWKVNKQHPVRPEVMNQLLDAIQRLTSLSPVPARAHDNVLKELMQEHVDVKAYDANGKLLKHYLTGKATVNNDATYMLLMNDGKPANRPHIVYIPGFRGYVTPRYELDPEVWRSRGVFTYDLPAIKEVSVNYPSEPEKSFRITRLTPDSFALNPLDEKYAINEIYKQRYVQQYLEFYSFINIEAYDNIYSGRDSMTATAPYCAIHLTTTDGRTRKADLYRMPINKRSKAQFDMKGNELTYDVDRYYVSLDNNTDFAVVQHYVFGKLMRSYKDFFFKPGSEPTAAKP